MSVILNVTFDGASIFPLACLGGSALELAFLPAFVVISIKTHLSDQVKIKDN